MSKRKLIQGELGELQIKIFMIQFRQGPESLKEWSNETGKGGQEIPMGKKLGRNQREEAAFEPLNEILKKECLDIF